MTAWAIRATEAHFILIATTKHQVTWMLLCFALGFM